MPGPRVRVRPRRVSAPGARWRRMRARGRGGGGRGAARGRPGGGGGRAGGRAARRGPATAGSNGEAGAAPANYISGTSIIRGKTRKRWRPAPGGPLPERPGPSLLLLRPPSSPRRPRPAPPPPRPRPRPHGRTLGRAAAGRAQPPPPPMRLVARLQVGPADTQPRGEFSAAGGRPGPGTPRHSRLSPQSSLFWKFPWTLAGQTPRGREGVWSPGEMLAGGGGAGWWRGAHGVCGAAGAPPGFPSLWGRGACVAGRCSRAPNLYFSCLVGGRAWRPMGPFGILLTSEVRLQQDGDGGRPGVGATEDRSA